MPILGSLGAISENSFRGNLDDYADDFAFTNITNANPGTLYTSGIATITGINYKIRVSVVGAGTSFSVNGDAFSTSPRFMRDGNTLQLQLRTLQDFLPIDFSRQYNANVTAGKRNTIWTVTTRPDGSNLVPVIFNSISNLPVDTAVSSNTVTISGLESGYTVLVGVDGTYQGTINQSGFGALISINGGPLVTSGVVGNGDNFYIYNPAVPGINQSSYSQTRNIPVSVGTYTTTWNIITESPDLIPNNFSFNNIIGADINTTFISNSITVSGITATTIPKFAIPINIFGEGFEYNKNGAAFTEFLNGTVVSGDVIRLRKVTGNNYSTSSTGTLVIGGVSASWNVTTKAQPFDTIPDAFSFTSVNGVSRSSSFTSNEITLSGMTPGFFGSASVSGGQFKVIRSGSIFSNFSSNSINVQLGDIISLRDTSSPSYSTTKTTTFTVSGFDINGNPGSTSASWNITTESPPVVFGCTDPSATNYNPSATQNNGTCTFAPPPPPPPILGCTNPSATNYNPSATQDNGTCIFPCFLETRTSTYGVGFRGYLLYNNLLGQPGPTGDYPQATEFIASNGSDGFMTGLNSTYAGLPPFITASGFYTTWQEISTRIISYYITRIRRYPETLGFDGWIEYFVYTPGFSQATGLNQIDLAIEAAFVQPGGERDFQIARGGIYGNFYCRNPRTRVV